MANESRGLPRGVTALDRPRGGRSFRASIRRDGQAMHLGLYESAYLAGLAYHIAAEAIGRRSSPPDEAPGSPRPSADQIRVLTIRVRRRLGLEKRSRADFEVEAPEHEAILTFFEVTVLGFWRQQAGSDSGDSPGTALDVAAGRVVESIAMLRWGRLPDPCEILGDLVSRRVDRAFRRGELGREILDDDGDEPWRLARWLVYPEGRGFAEEIRRLYPEFFAEEAGADPGWAATLGIAPPFSFAAIREAYRRRSKTAHPDRGGSADEFVRLQSAYEAAMSHCRSRGGTI